MYLLFHINSSASYEPTLLSNAVYSVQNRTFDVNLHATKPRTLVKRSEYFWCHKWVLPSLMSLLFHINSSASYEPTLLSNAVYSVQNIYWVTAISSSDNPQNNVLITLLTCFLWSLSEWYFSSLRVWVITHNIHPVTEKSVLVCNCLFLQILGTKELRISNIYESLLYGSSLSIFPSHLLSLSDELHTFSDDYPDNGNSPLLSISDDDLIMEIFVVLEYK